MCAKKLLMGYANWIERVKAARLKKHGAALFF
jgi:hypothetical protein